MKKLLMVAFGAASLLIASGVFAQWEPDRRLTFNDSLSRTGFWSNAWCVAAGPGGDVHVVWFDCRDAKDYKFPFPTWEIYYKRSTDNGITWEADTRLTYYQCPKWYPAVAVSGTNVHVVWQDDRDQGGLGSEIYYKRSTDNGTTWGADTRLTYNIFGSSSMTPCVAVSGSNMHVVWWDSRDGRGTEIYYKRSTDSGTTWGTETRLTNASGFSEFPSVAVSGVSVHVVWFDDRSGYGIYYKRSTDNGITWGADTPLIVAAWAASPSVAVSGTNVHVFWNDERSGINEIYYKRSTDNGTTWEADTCFTSDTSWSYYPNVAVSGTNVHLSWTEERDGNDEIYYKRSTDTGTTWGADTRLSNGPSYSVLSSVAVFGTIVHVVWEDARDGNEEIYYKRNPTGNPSGVEENAEVRRQGLEVRFKATPNPFSSFATIPGHLQEKFSLYDISGRRVGTYTGDRIGEGLRAGVYFLKSEDKSSRPVRIVKVR